MSDPSRAVASIPVTVAKLSDDSLPVIAVNACTDPTHTQITGTRLLQFKKDAFETIWSDDNAKVINKISYTQEKSTVDETIIHITWE